MRIRTGRRAFARWAGQLLVALLTVAWASLAVAQIAEYDEPPSQPRVTARAQPAPAESTPTLGSSEAPNPAPPARRPAPVARSVAAPASAGSARGTEFPYTVRPGDSLGSIAATFGMDAQDLARANHIGVDTVLMIGRNLRIPNPFAAQVRSLSAQVDGLRTAAATANERAAAATLKNRSTSEKLVSLAADNEALRLQTVALPRWRGTAVTAGIVALLMLGVTMVTLFEWWLLRRRFGELVRITDSLTDLDQKYKRALAKAELRFQQLYGRRRPAGTETAESGKSAEEIEIERLNHELREALEHQLSRLGVPRSRPRRSRRWREMLDDVEPPVEARSVRR
jgi:LysM repeat protein